VVNFADRGLQLTRAVRAIKVWLAVQTFGVDAFRAAIDRSIDLTIAAQQWIQADSHLELVSPASLGILTFRRRGLPHESSNVVDRRNEEIVTSLALSGDVVLTSTVIAGRYAIRLCVLNHTSGEADVRYALERVASVEIAEAAAGPQPDEGADRAARQAALTDRWLTAHEVTPDDLRTIAGFGSVTEEQAVRFLGTAHEERYKTGQPITERWAQARTFYIVLDGRLSVRLNDHEVNALGVGDHLGEIAAIDWGRDFSYGRTAAVIATAPTSVLAFPASALRELMADAPDVDRAMRRIAQTRLQSS
jgi:hypothetical protein